MERKSPFIKGKKGHHEIKNPYLIERERGSDRALYEMERSANPSKKQLSRSKKKSSHRKGVM